MKTKELWRATLRDLKANPRKAVILGLLAAAAAYFWVPLAAGAFKKSPRKSIDPAALMAQVGFDSPTALPQDATKSAPWHVLVATRDAHDFAQPLKELELEHDPFAPAVVAPPEPDPAAVVAAAADEDEDDEPTESGLTLSGTLIGKFGRRATINGHSYRPGDEVDDANEARWRVLHIEARYVVIAQGTETRKLRMPRTMADELREQQADAGPPR